jgi:hypothetical protein
MTSQGYWVRGRPDGLSTMKLRECSTTCWDARYRIIKSMRDAVTNLRLSLSSRKDSSVIDIGTSRGEQIARFYGAGVQRN